MKKIFLALLVFMFGYVAGEQQTLLLETDAQIDGPIVDTGKPLRIEYEYKVPTICLDTISFGLLTELNNTARIRDFRKMAFECHEVIDKEFDYDDTVSELPDPVTVIIPERPDAINPHTGEPITNEEYDDAFTDCLDEEGLEEETYCDENYEDWLLD